MNSLTSEGELHGDFQKRSGCHVMSAFSIKRELGKPNTENFSSVIARIQAAGFTAYPLPHPKYSLLTYQTQTLL